MNMKKILFVAGCRPNFVKIAALMRVAKKYEDRIESLLIHTGQHYNDELSRVFFNDFSLPEPIANLNIGSASRGEQIRAIIQGMSPHLTSCRPDLVVVVGDVNSTLGAALAAVSCGLPLAHVEAGLRSRNWLMPEELNRTVADHLSDLLFVTEESAIRNLENEGISKEKIHFVGNIMVDTLLHFLPFVEKSGTFQKYGLKPNEYALVTMHRAENVNNRRCFSEIFEALSSIGKFIKIVWPLHPRTVKTMEDFGLKDESHMILPAQSYLDFLALQKNARFVITDSGGVQEETTILDVPCLTIRTETERPVTCELGTSEIVGVEKEKIISAAQRANGGNWKRRAAEIPFWDGKAAERIMKIIAEYLKV